MIRALCAILLLAGLAAGADGGKTESAPITLTPASSKVLPIQPFSYSGSVQCDGKNNLYFYVGSRPRDSVVYELLADGTHNVIGLTGKDGADNYYVAFRVDPDGKLWLLAADKTDHPIIFELHDDATSPTATKLDTPEDLNALTIQNFIVLQSGHILVHGYLNEKAGKEERGHSYLADFEPSGRLVRKTVGKGVAAEAADWAAQAPALEGEDRLIYLLELDKVVLVSQAGKKIREITLDPPEPDFRPYKMYLSGRRLVVAFSKNSPAPAKVVARYALFDTSSGERLRLYQPDPELGNNLLCFSSEGFTFYRVEHGNIKLVTARPE